MGALQFLKGGNVAALRRWVGKVGFNEALPHVAKHVTGGDTERAKKVVGKLKGMAKKEGELAPEHAYGQPAKKKIKKGGAEGAEGTPPGSPPATDKDTAAPARGRRLTGGADMGGPLVPGDHYEPDEDQLGGAFDADADDMKKGEPVVGAPRPLTAMGQRRIAAKNPANRVGQPKKTGYVPQTAATVKQQGRYIPQTRATATAPRIAKACGPKSIGTTRSGKEVFGMPSHNAHWKYTADDHDDAARLHEEAGRATQAAQHRHKARKLRSNGHDTRSPFAKSGGEGSRGGQIVGHTKSGHAIYRGGMTHSDRGRQLYGKTDKAHVHESPHLIEHEGKTWVRAGHNSDTGGVSYDEHDPKRHVIDKEHDYGDVAQRTTMPDGKPVFHLRGLPKKVGGDLPTQIHDPHHGHLTVRGHNSDTNTSTYHRAEDHPGWPAMQDEPEAKTSRARISGEPKPKKTKSFADRLQGTMNKMNKRTSDSQRMVEEAHARAGRPGETGPINIMDLIGKGMSLFERQRFLKTTIVGGGEGSHGGRVMGHTKSGKPIYMSLSYAAHRAEHQNFTPEDHQEALSKHAALANRLLDIHKGMPKTKAAKTERDMVGALQQRHSDHVSWHATHKLDQQREGRTAIPPSREELAAHAESVKPIYAEHRQRLRAYMNREPGAQMPSQQRSGRVDRIPTAPGGQGNLFTRKASLFERQRAFLKGAIRATCVGCKKPMSSESENVGQALCPTCRKPRPLDAARQTDLFARKASLFDRQRALVKAGGSGEGSRGGRIIGHTKSGKPVYYPGDKKHSASQFHSALMHHAGKHEFDSRDHDDAAAAHEKAARGSRDRANYLARGAWNEPGVGDKGPTYEQQAKHLADKGATERHGEHMADADAHRFAAGAHRDMAQRERAFHQKKSEAEYAHHKLAHAASKDPAERAHHQRRMEEAATRSEHGEIGTEEVKMRRLRARGMWTEPVAGGRARKEARAKGKGPFEPA